MTKKFKQILPMDFNMEIFFNNGIVKKESALNAPALAIVSLPQGGIAKTKHSVNIY